MSRDVSLRIAVCDDEGHIHDKIAELLDIYAENKRITYHLYHIYSGQELLEFTEEIDILLLDIDMPESELFEAVDEVRERMVGIETVSVWKDQVAYEIIQRDILYIAAEKNVTEVLL